MSHRTQALPTPRLLSDATADMLGNDTTPDSFSPQTARKSCGFYMELPKGDDTSPTQIQSWETAGRGESWAKTSTWLDNEETLTVTPNAHTVGHKVASDDSDMPHSPRTCSSPPNASQKYHLAEELADALDVPPDSRSPSPDPHWACAVDEADVCTFRVHDAPSFTARRRSF